MLTTRPIHYSLQRGTTLIEVVITIVILAFGLLGLAGLQGQIHLSLVESYQRAQAVLLLADMQDRLSANRLNAASYVITGSLGTGDSQSADCTSITLSSDRDQCEWSNMLKGAAEIKSSANVGAMIGARGCITQVQASNPAPGVCTPGIYLVSVAWQGLNKTTAPDVSVTCAQGSYGDEKLRRIISERVSVGLPNCL